MRIQRPDHKGWTISFVYSPFFEMMCSLHVLFHPDHHKGREKWAKSTAIVMDKDLYDRLKHFDVVTDSWLGPMEFQRQDEIFNDFSVIRAIHQLEKLPLITFVDCILNRAVPMPDIRKMLVLGKVHVTMLNQEQMDFILNAEIQRDELISLLKTYYYLYFYMIQVDCEPFMVRTLQAHKALSESMTFESYIQTLHPRIETDHEKFSLHKYKRFDFKYEAIRKIDIGISTFIDPHLLMGEEDGLLSLTIRACFEKVDSDVHEDLVSVLKALGDKTRLRLLKHLYAKPCSTQELAECIGISEAGVSKHLKLLHEARMVRKMRKGNFILYYLDKMMIDRIPMDTYQYLDEN